MAKRILALALCIVMLVPCLASCSSLKYEGDVGAYITMYLTDDIYDFDPANAYYNADTINVVSMLFDTLFTLDENGKVKKSLAKEYKFFVDERTDENCMEITIEPEAYWTNGTKVSAADVEFAWRRLLSPSNDYAAASLLYDIKNARAAKEGDVSINHIGVEAVSQDVLRITFETEVDKDRFLLNLTSVATAPLLESYVSRNDDWAKKAATIVTSGAYKLGKIQYDEAGGAVTDDYALDKSGDYLTESGKLKKIDHFYLERNVYYRRDVSRDKINSAVKNYRILVDCSKTDAEILDDYKNGKIFYMGSIPMSLRGDALVQAEAQVSNALSTFVLYMNEYAAIANGSSVDYIFANAKVRQALSLVIDREAIAKEVVFAEAATGLVAPGVFDAVKYNKKDFRDNGTDLLATSANKQQAQALLAEAGVTPASYAFSIKVAAYDDVHVAIVEKVAAAWNDLGFKVTVEKVAPIENNDYSKELVSPSSKKADETPSDVCDDLIVESLKRGTYEVLACDYTAYSADAFSVLSNFAMSFSGASMDFSNPNVSRDFSQLTTNVTGYASVEYNTLMEAIYYLPYFAELGKTATDSFLRKAYTSKPYADTAKALAQNALLEAEAVKEGFDKLNTWKCAEKSCGAVVVSLTEPEQCEQCGKVVFEYKYDDATRNSYFNNAVNALLSAGVDIARSFDVSKQTNTVADTVAQINKALLAAKLGTTTTEDLEALADQLIEASRAATTAADNADNRTLYEIIAKIYQDNGITPSKKVTDSAKQKTVLLHKAEELLMKDLPVIPVIFNQNAVLVSNQLKGVSATYYTAAAFQKTTLKNYEEYTYTLERTKKEKDGSTTIVSSEISSIFDAFPKVKWEDQGKTVQIEQYSTK